MIRSATQKYRQLAIDTWLGPDTVLLDRFVGSEGLSELFHFELRLLALPDTLDPTLLLGENVTFQVRRDDGSARFFNGQVRRLAQIAENDQFVTYEAEVVPRLALLQETQDCRIYQHVSTPQILRTIFNEFGITDVDLRGLSGDYEAREYCVQYGESYFDFVSRLMEEEGIFYFFEHDNGKHTLCLGDSPHAYRTIGEDHATFVRRLELGGQSVGLTNWRRGKQIVPSQVALTDYNYSDPSLHLLSHSETHIASISELQLERFEYPGNFEQRREGVRLADMRQEELEVEHEWIEGEGMRWTFAAGGVFRAKHHQELPGVDSDYVIRRIHYTAGAVGSYTTGEQRAEQPWSVRFTAFPAQMPYRPPRVTRRPVIDGPQTAVVVGNPGEEIDTDDEGHARVKLHFPWDRRGSFDRNSSCWVRVSQAHAGAGFGSLDMPRIGDEVIVAFLDGDPDRPIVKGRVYNGEQRAPFALPYQKTRSGWKTQTVNGSGYNELSLDDTPGRELLRTNAQRDLDTQVGNDQSLEVSVNRTMQIGENDEVKIGANVRSDVTKDQKEKIKGDLSYDVQGDLVIDAGTAITFQVGSSKLHMNQAGVIKWSGKFVSSLAMAIQNIVSPVTLVNGSTLLNQAGLVCLDLGVFNHINAKAMASVAGSEVKISGNPVVVKGAPISFQPGSSGMAPPVAPGQGCGGGAAVCGPCAPITASGEDSQGQAGEGTNNPQSAAGAGSTPGLGATKQAGSPTTGNADEASHEPPELREKLTDIRKRMGAPNLSLTEEQDLHRQHAEIEQQLREANNQSTPEKPITEATATTAPADSHPKTAAPGTANSAENHPTDAQNGENAPSPSAEDELHRADGLERSAQRLDRQAEIYELYGEAQAEKVQQLRAESERRKLAAARIREGEKGVADKQKQLDAANGMRELFDAVDKGTDVVMPKPVKAVYDVVKYPLRDGLPQLTEKIIEIEQDLQDEFRKHVNNPAVRQQIEQAHRTLRHWLRGGSQPS